MNIRPGSKQPAVMAPPRSTGVPHARTLGNGAVSAGSAADLFAYHWFTLRWLLLGLCATTASLQAGDTSILFGPPRMMGRLDADQPAETSGMVASRNNPGILWMHNDGANRRLFGVRTNGQVAAALHLPFKTIDVEDIAIGPSSTGPGPHVYLGDIGDNEETRQEIRIYRFPEPVLPSTPRGPQSLIPAMETFHLSYPDGPHDAETLLVDPRTGDLLIVTKHPKKTRVYHARGDQLRDGASLSLIPAGQIAHSNISAGDVSADGTELILRREKQAWLWRREGAEPLWRTLAHPSAKIPVVGPPDELNGESLAFSPDASGYYTLSEGKRQPIYFFPRR